MEGNINQPQNLLSQDPALKIVMIGKVGGGKSATGNTILGRRAFQSRILSDFPVTQECQVETGVVDGQNLTIIDTPGLFGSTKTPSAGLSHVEKQKKEMEQIKKCMTLPSPCPVVFLVVLQLGQFTEEERQTVRIIQRTFGRDAVHYTMALFTRGDDLKTEGVSIDELIGAHPALRDFIRECRGGYHVFDNRDKDPSQVTELLQKINSMVQRHGERYCENAQEDEGDLQNRECRGGYNVFDNRDKDPSQVTELLQKINSMVQRNGERSSEKAQEVKGDLQNNSFMKTCLEGAFDGMCIMCIILLVESLIEGCPSSIHVERFVGMGCAHGAAAGAVRYAVCRLI